VSHPLRSPRSGHSVPFNQLPLVRTYSLRCVCKSPRIFTSCSVGNPESSTFPKNGRKSASSSRFAGYNRRLSRAPAVRCKRVFTSESSPNDHSVERHPSCSRLRLRHRRHILFLLKWTPSPSGRVIQTGKHHSVPLTSWDYAPVFQTSSSLLTDVGLPGFPVSPNPYIPMLRKPTLSRPLCALAALRYIGINMLASLTSPSARQYTVRSLRSLPHYNLKEFFYYC
jgi:hypothetical protein